jgi:hypothetical protein
MRKCPVINKSTAASKRIPLNSVWSLELEGCVAGSRMQSLPVGDLYPSAGGKLIESSPAGWSILIVQ